MLVNSGRDHQAAAIGGDLAGVRGTATASSATTLTDSGATFGTNVYTGHIVVAGSTGANLVYGVIVSHTGTVLTVDRWYNFNDPGGTAGTTPSATAPYCISPGQAPAWYMGLTANSGAPAAGDTSLTGEITTAGGGLVRKLAAYAHTGGANTYTLTTTYTVNGSDSIPVTVAKMATFTTLTGAGRMVHETLLTPSTATLSAVSDQLTVTQTVTMS